MKNKTNRFFLASVLCSFVLSGCSLPNMELPNLSEIIKQQSELSSQKVEESYSFISSHSSNNVSIEYPSNEYPFSHYYINGSYHYNDVTLYINEDCSVSWNDADIKYPATLIEHTSVFYHIVTDPSVAPENQLDVYLGAGIVYVIRNGQEYILSVRNEQVYTTGDFRSQDGRIRIFCLGDEYYSNARFMAVIDGVFRPIVRITKGKTFISKGTVFFVDTDEFGQSHRTFRLTDDQFVEECVASEKRYDGSERYDYFYLYTDENDEPTSFFLEKEYVNIESFTVDGNVFTDTSNDYSYINSTSDDIIFNKTIKRYVLDDENMLFTRDFIDTNESLCHTLSDASGSFSGNIQNNTGIIWFRFNFPSNGKLYINELIGIASGANGTPNTSFCLFEASEGSYYARDYSSILVGENELASGSFDIVGGINYIMKVSAYEDRFSSFHINLSNYEGYPESFEWEFLPNN